MNRTNKGASKDALFRLLGEGADKLIIAVLLGSICLFVLYPILRIFGQSFLVDGGLNFEAFSEVWKGYRTSLWNSLFSSALTAVLCTMLSIAAALAISSSRGWVKLVMMGLILITMVSPPFVSSLAYIQLYGRRGWITYRLLGLTWNPYNCWGVIWMQSISFVPMNALFLSGILTKMDASSIQAARDLGAKPRHILLDVVLPLIRPGILVTLLLTFVRAIADFGTPTIIGGRFNTLASDIYIQLIGYSNPTKAAAMNVILLVPTLIAFLAYRVMLERSDKLTAGRGRQNVVDLKLHRCGPVGIVAMVLSALFFVMMVLQYGCIFASGFMKVTKGVYSFSWEYVRQLIKYDSATILRSVVYALIVSLVGTFFAMLFAYYTGRRRVPGRRFFDFLVMLPYMIPGTCFGIGYILAFNKEPLKLTGTALIVMACMLFKQLPTTTKLCSAALTQVPRTLELSARDLGGGRMAVLRDVILPGMKTAFFTCFTHNFSSSMTTAGAIIFLINPGKKLLVFNLFDKVYLGEYPMASLIATLIIVIVLAVEGLVWLISRREGKRYVS